LLALWLAGLGGMSDFEGGRGMFAFLGVGPLGGIVAMIVTIWVVLRVGRGKAAFGPMIGRVAMVLAGIAAVVVGGIALWTWSIDTYSNELPPRLEFELRIPTAMAPKDRSEIDVELNTDKNGADALLTDMQPDGDVQVAAGTVELAFKTNSRLLVVKIPNQPTRLYTLRLGRSPDSTRHMTDWARPDFIHDTTKDESPQKAPADDQVLLRHKVTRAGDDETPQ
jgi:hypothetical protein